MAQRFMNIGAVTVGNPAAATNFSYTVPDGPPIRVVGVDFILTTGAGATSRKIRIQGFDGVSAFNTHLAAVVQAATITGNVHANRGGSTHGLLDATNQWHSIGLDVNFVLNPGEILRSAIVGITGTDQISAIVIRRELL